MTTEQIKSRLLAGDYCKGEPSQSIISWARSIGKRVVDSGIFDYRHYYIEDILIMDKKN